MTWTPAFAGVTNVKEFLTRYTSRLLKKAHLLRWRARALVAAYQ